MEYTFRTSAYDVELLVPEVSQALETRVELASRKRLPGMWKVTDSLSQKHTSDPMPRGRLIYRRVVGIALIVLGLFMMIPGLMKPQELLLPLFAGVCGLVFGINALWSTRKKPVKETTGEPAGEQTKKPSKRFEDTARTFLTNLAKVEPTEVRFSEDGMHLGEHAVIGYGEIEHFIETPLGYLLSWSTQATFLQKRDLQGGALEEFQDCVSEKMSRG